MADKPTDETTAVPPPRRRAPRSKTATAAKPKRATGAKTARRAPSKASTVSEAVAAPKTTVVKAAAATKSAATKAVTQAKPKVRAAATKIGAAERSVTKSNFGKGFLIGGALAAIAATIAGIFGRKKIADATTKSIDAVIGKTEDTPIQPTMSAD